MKDFKHFGLAYFHDLVDQKLSERTIDRLHMKRWEFFPAPSQSDIIWEDFTKDSVIGTTKTVILWVFLLLLSVVLITPVVIFDYWKKLEEKMNLSYKFVNGEDVNEYVKSLAAVIVSLILIPFFIDMMVLMEDWRTKSERQVAIMRRNYIFMIINMLFLNLTGNSTIKAFLHQVERQDLQSWPQYLAQQMLSCYSFFINYFI